MFRKLDFQRSSSMGIHESQPFPLSKLLFMFVKSIAKPITKKILNRAKTDPFFKNYICLPPAKMYHFYESKIKFRAMNIGRVRMSQVPKLSDKESVELGASLFSEMSIMTVAMAVLGNEVRKHKLRETRLEEQHEQEREELVEDVVKLDNHICQQELQISRLHHLLQYYQNTIKPRQNLTKSDTNDRL